MINRYQSATLKKMWSLKSRYSMFLKVELAVMESLYLHGKIDVETLHRLKQATFTLKAIEAKEKVLKHDVLAFIETCMASLGDEKRFFHYGLTSTDVVDTAQSLTLKKVNTKVSQLLRRLIQQSENMAQQYAMTPIMGRTHGMYAEVMPLGLRWMRFASDLKRAQVQFNQARKLVEVVKLSGAVGAYSILDRSYEDDVSKLLKLGIQDVSSQVLSRDRHATYMSALTLISSIIEGLATDIRLYARSDVSEMKEGFSKGQKGSSAMPHKKNPITSENLTGLSRMMRGYLLMAFENIALWHERDISHSSVERVMLEDATSLMEHMLIKTSELLEDLVIDDVLMSHHIDETFGTAFTQIILHHAIDLNMDRKTVYETLQRLSFKAIQTKTHLKTLILNDASLSLLHEDIKSLFNVDNKLKKSHPIFNSGLK
jgi:adenylosuccinate lyase